MTGLTFGALDLMGGGAIKLYALGTDEGTDWGNPGPIESQLNSFLQFGALVASEGWENRTVMVAVEVVGTGPVRLAAEAALAAEVGFNKRNVLLYTPPDSTVATRYEVLASSFDQVPNDLAEVTGKRRVYMLRLVCLPFAFSTDETLTAPFTPPASVTTTTVDDGTSATNWSAYDYPGFTEALSTSGGAIVSDSTYTLSSPDRVVTGALRSASVTMTGTPYLAVDCQFVSTPNWQLIFTEIQVNGVTQTPVASTPLPNGFTRYWLQPSGSVSSIGVYGTWDRVPQRLQTIGEVISSVRVDQIQRSNSYSAVSSTKQLQRTLTIGGSAPTTGSFAIEHETSALGDVLLYTSSAAYSPAMRAFKTATASFTSDGTAVSGGYDTVTANSGYTLKYLLPYSALPDGEYLVMGRFKTSAATGVGVKFGVVSGSTEVSAQQVYFPDTGTLSAWTFKRLGMIHLPISDAGPSTKISVEVTKVGGTLQVDELYLLNLTTGDLTQVACGTAAPAAGGSSNRAWVDSPSVTNDGLGGLRRGYAADQSDAIGAYDVAAAPSIHEFAPPSVMAFTVTSNADSAAISFRHRRAWVHTAAA